MTAEPAPVDSPVPGSEATGTDTPLGAGGRPRPKRRYQGGERGARWAAYATDPVLHLHHSNVRSKPDDHAPPRA